MGAAVACVAGADSRTLRRDLQRETPPGLSKRDVKVLRSVQRRAHYLDKGFHICGMRFGWTFIIGAFASTCNMYATDVQEILGIIPGAGDAADAALNYLLVVRKAKQAEYVARHIISRALCTMRMPT